MAKLEGVKTLGMADGEITKIEYNKEVFEKVTDGSPDQVGDIVAGRTMYGFGFYNVVGIDEADGGGMFYDENDIYNGMIRYDTFRKVGSIPSELTEVGGPVVGGYVVFSEDFLDTTAGRTYEIIEVSSSLGEFEYVDDAGDDHAVTNGDFGPTFYAKDSEKGAPEALFAKVNRPDDEPIVGDYIVLIDDAAMTSYLTEDKKYEITRIDEDGGFLFDDDNGEGEWVDSRDIKEIYVKYTQDQEEQEAKVGDKILVVNATVTGGNYDDGDVLTVTELNCMREGAIAVKEHSIVILPEEFIVINPEQASEQEPEFLPQKGDIVVITDNTNSSRNKVGDIGKVGEETLDRDELIVRVYVEGRDAPYANDCFTKFSEMRLATDEERARYYRDLAAKSFAEGDYVVAKEDNPYRITVPEAGALKVVESGGGVIRVELQREYKRRSAGTTYSVSATDFRVATGEEIVETLGIDSVAVGDTVEVLAEDHQVFDKGDQFTVAKVDRDGDVEDSAGYMIVRGNLLSPRFKVVKKAPEQFAYPSQLERYISEPKSPSPYGEISVGDTVKVVMKDGEEPERGWGAIDNGDVGVVTHVRTDGKITVNFLKHPDWFAEEPELIKVAENGDLLPGTVVYNDFRGANHVIEKRRPDMDEYGKGVAYVMEGHGGTGWLGTKQFEVMTKEEAKKQVDPEEVDEEGIEATTKATIEEGDLVKVIKSPGALPEGSYFIVKSVSLRYAEDSRGYVYGSEAGEYLEIVAKAADVYA